MSGEPSTWHVGNIEGVMLRGWSVVEGVECPPLDWALGGAALIVLLVWAGRQISEPHGGG